MCNGFFKFPRELLCNPIWKSLSFEYRHIFQTIMANVAFKETTMNDHGVLVSVKPGQLLITQRELTKLCDEDTIDRPKVQRALALFEKLGLS